MVPEYITKDGACTLLWIEPVHYQGWSLLVTMNGAMYACKNGACIGVRIEPALEPYSSTAWHHSYMHTWHHSYTLTGTILSYVQALSLVMYRLHPQLYGQAPSLIGGTIF